MSRFVLGPDIMPCQIINVAGMKYATIEPTPQKPRTAPETE